jgi:tRNA-dihydrouridine synthase 2
MLARAAERNPSIFDRAGPSCNLKVIIPQLLRIAQHIDNPWGNTKFLLSQFKPGSEIGKEDRKRLQEDIARSKSVEDICARLGVDAAGGADLLQELEAILADRKDACFTEP